MLALADFLAQEVLGCFLRPRGQPLPDAAGVTIVHEPDVALCTPTPSDARQDLSPLPLSSPARFAGACPPARRWGVLRARRRGGVAQERDKPGGGAAHPLRVRLPLRHRHRVDAEAPGELVLRQAESDADTLDLSS